MKNTLRVWESIPNPLYLAYQIVYMGGPTLTLTTSSTFYTSGGNMLYIKKNILFYHITSNCRTFLTFLFQQITYIFIVKVAKSLNNMTFVMVINWRLRKIEYKILLVRRRKGNDCFNCHFNC